jgi:acyl dehydratase
MIDRKHIGTLGKSFTVDVEKGQLKLFAEVIGENNKIYSDETVAKAAGYLGVLAPPTFVFSLSLDDPSPGSEFVALNIDPAKVLHAKQQFDYFHPVYSGDTLTFKTELVDLYEKKNGALEFIVNRIVATNQRGTKVAQMDCTTVVRH